MRKNAFGSRVKDAKMGCPICGEFVHELEGCLFCTNCCSQIEKGFKPIEVLIVNEEDCHIN